MSDPRSILLHVDNTARSAARIRLARLIAEAFDAQVTGLACLHHGLNGYALTWEASASIVSVLQTQDRAYLEKAHASFVRESGGSERLQWAEPLVDGLVAFVGRAWYADLVVLGQRDPSDQATEDMPPDFVSEVLLRSGRPVLVLPHVGVANPLGDTVLIAWKPTREAAHAVSAALPWLKRAKQVHVICCAVDAPAALVHLEHWLSAHGIKVIVHDGGQEPYDVGKLLLAMAAQVGADLMVMGAYGHSRAREWVLGGATRGMLQSMNLPVLMAH